MKKIIMIILSAVIMIAATVFVSFAEDAPEEVYIFSVVDKDGNTISSGASATDFKTAVGNLADGDTIVLNGDIRTDAKTVFTSTEDAPKTVNINLNGYKIYSLRKTTLISVVDYTTLNIYSSEPGGVLYVTDDSMGGNVLNIVGDNAVINIGEMTVGDVTYPGTNVSTYCSCLIDLYAESNYKPTNENSFVNINGGSHYSIHSDYSGYIIPRCGKATFNIKNADIYLFETRAPINSAGADTTLNMENCRMLQYNAVAVKLFNSANGTVNLKDCIFTNSLGASAGSTGTVNLIGRNVFNSSGEEDLGLVVGGSDLKVVTTYSSYEMNSGVKEITYFDKSGSFVPVVVQLPELLNASRYVSEEGVKYRFIKGKNKVEQLWAADEEPEFPFEIEDVSVQGIYKSGYFVYEGSDGCLTYEAGLVEDFKLKVSAVYSDEYLYFNIFIPAYLIDEGYIDFVNVKIMGDSYAIDDWDEREIDGERYAVAMTREITPDNVNDLIVVNVPFDYLPDKVYVNASWTFTLNDYVNRVLETESEGLYSAEEYALVTSIKEDYLSE